MFRLKMCNLKFSHIILPLFLNSLFPPVIPFTVIKSNNSENNRNNSKYPKLDKLLDLSDKSQLQFVPSSNKDLARYAFTFLHNPGGVNSSTTTSTSGTNSTLGVDMAATAIGEIMSQIRDPFKHGVTSALLAGLYILALISLIVFATTGTLAFICSFVDCRNFFLGMKPENAMRRRGANGSSGPNFSSAEFGNLPWMDEPIFERLQEHRNKNKVFK